MLLANAHPFAYHLHWKFSNWTFTESTTIGLGWYIVLFAAVLLYLAVIMFSERNRHHG